MIFYILIMQDDILQLEQGNALEISGETISPNEIKIVREFKLPSDAKPGELDAAGDGEVLVVVDLSYDESLLAAGTAREVVNRVQKLRKKAGLSIGDPISVFLEAYKSSQELWSAIDSQMGYILETVGTSFQRAENVTVERELIIAETATVPLGDGFESQFEIRIFREETIAGTFRRMNVDDDDDDDE